ncbi:MAG: HD domain-containing protein [Candidatus Woesebacteria bacterium]|nr:HD domain-containing protein [Candidatus Woesebacteria bacterium]
MERDTQNQGQSEKLIESSAFLTEAYKLADKAHRGQKRAEGIPYITHPLGVFEIVNEEWEITNEEILAGTLLHDTPEDSNITNQEIRSKFGINVASWVEGATQLRSEKGNISKEEEDKETLRKLDNASYIEPQVGVIKLGDRLHNMRTLEFMPVLSQVRKAKETLFYAKLAESLGMWDVMRELEDLSLKYIDIKEYEKYLDLRDNDPRTQPEFVDGLKSKLEVVLKDARIEARVEARKNSLLRIKHKRGSYLPEKIDDLIRFGIMVKESGNTIETRNRVMLALGALWQEFDTIENKAGFDNFFFTARDNGYSALHLTLEFPEGYVRIALTSEEKELYNNRGILGLINKGETDLHKYALKLVFTPTKEVKFFRPNATGVDYAYSISQDMGASAKYVLFDGERHELTEVIPNGATIEIKRGEPRLAPKKVLKNFALPPARRIIEEQLDEQIKFEKTMEGKRVVERIIQERGLIDLEDLTEIEELKPVFDDILLLLGCKEKVMDLYHKIGSGVMDVATFTDLLDTEGITKGKMGFTTIYVEGHDQPGMSKNIIGQATDLGANINFQKGNKSKINATFSLKLIVENLSKKSEKELSKALHSDPRITKIIVV